MSAPNWSLLVEDFGPIKKAEVTLAPLVLLVGKNNLGKSYLASLLWGLLNPFRIFGTETELGNGKEYSASAKLLRDLRQGDKRAIEQSDWKVIADWINANLSDDAAMITRRILTCDDCRYAKAVLTPTEWPDDLKVEFRTVPRRNDGRRSAVVGRRLVRISRNVLQIFTEEGEQITEGQDSAIMRYLARHLLSGSAWGSPVYIPAARTGLMLAFKTLVASLLRTLERDDDSASRTTLAAPVVDFLQYLSDIMDFAGRNGSHFKIAEDLERDVLGGTITQGENEELGYTPKDSSARLPMHVVSSLVTELTPLVILLKAGLQDQTIIFEEPEAHLHLSAQRMLARSLARLVNSGAQVVITTHSDTLLQQVNILMYLHGHPRRDELAAELGYTADELVDPRLANGYLFKDSDSGTIVREMTKTRQGFVEPVMNETIAALTREVLRLEETDVESGNG